MKKLLFAFLMIVLSTTFIKAQTITSVSPDTAAQGSVLTITISGVGTHFLSATGTNVWLEKGLDIINPTSFNATSETALTAGLTLSSGEPVGPYDVIVQNSLDGTLTLAGGFNVVLIVGMNYTSKDINLVVYPNPACDYVFVSSKLTEINDVDISLLDYTGKAIKKIEKKNVNSFNEKMNINDFPAGVYYLVVKVNDIYYTKKFVKK